MAELTDLREAPAAASPGPSQGRTGWARAARRPAPSREPAGSAFAPTHASTFPGRRAVLWLLAPTLVVLAVFLYYPMLRTVWLSFFRVRFYGQQQVFAWFDN